jgi:hypothetical protein
MLITIRYSAEHHDAHIIGNTINTFVVTGCSNNPGTVGSMKRCFRHQVIVTIKSVVAPSEKVNIPGSSTKVNLSDISKTGGFVNAYEAVKVASTLKSEKQKDILPKSKMLKKNKAG